MKRLLSLGFILLLTTPALAQVPSTQPDTPFKLATFEAGGTIRVGLVLGDMVLDIQGANDALTSAEELTRIEIPNEMRALIESYAQTKTRLYQIANYYSGPTSADRRSCSASMMSH